MARRAKGEGSYRLRPDGRWEARLTVEENGRRRQRSFFGKTQSEARKKMLAASRLLEDNLPLPSETLTVKAYLLNWLKGKTELAPESYRRYEDHCRLHLIPELGHHKLAKLQPAHLRTAYAAI